MVRCTVKVTLSAMSWRIEFQTEQYVDRDSSMARATCSSVAAPSRSTCRSMATKRAGWPAARRPESDRRTASAGTRDFFRKWTMSMPMQPANAMSSACIGEGPPGRRCRASIEASPAAAEPQIAGPSQLGEHAAAVPTGRAGVAGRHGRSSVACSGRAAAHVAPRRAECVCHNRRSRVISDCCSMTVTGRDIIDDLVNRMRTESEPLRYSSLAHGVYRVFLHRDDYERLAPARRTIVEEASRALDEEIERINAQRTARQRAGAALAAGGATRLVKPVDPPLRRPAGGWVIELFPDEDEELAPGHFRITSELMLPAHGGGARRGQIAGDRTAARRSRSACPPADVDHRRAAARDPVHRRRSTAPDPTATARDAWGELTYRDNLGREHTALARGRARASRARRHGHDRGRAHSGAGGRLARAPAPAPRRGRVRSS